MKNRCLVIIPTYNEVQSISVLLRSILKVDDRVDILVIDDASPDGTAQVIKTEFLSDRRVSLLRRRKKLGIGSAYRNGFIWGIEKGYGSLIQMDADFSHRPEDIPSIVDAIKDNDLVVGSRYVKGGGVKNWSWLRKLLSIVGLMSSKIVLGIPLRDLTSGFKCFRSDIFKKLDLSKIHSNGYFFQIEMNFLVHRLGRKIKEVPIIFEDTRVGQTKLSKAQTIKTFMRLPGLRAQGKDHPAISGDR